MNIESNGNTPAPNSTDELENLQSVIIQNVSHELRTPLAIIQGYAELLHGGDLGALAPDQQKAAVVIINRAQALRSVVEKLDTLMGLEANIGVAGPFALQGIAAKVLELRAPAAAQAQIALELHTQPDLPLVNGDPHHLEQAIDCLIDNALKFTAPGGRIDVRLYHTADSVGLSVSDTGIGIDPGDVERIFERFYQVDGSASRKYGGMGLGLAVVKSVVEAYNGHVHVSSQLDQGSTFAIELPALPADAKATHTTEVGTVLRRILIVDDEKNVAMTLRDGLEKLPDCEIVVATGGEEALQLFGQRPFDLLITDYKMPDIDGITLAARVQETYPHTTIIMITAYGDEALHGQATRASIRRVLDKPVRLKEIRNVAMEALSEPEEPKEP
ncbi:MAG: response regulator [Anaerolineae bacterium]|nr:response regulator [Anaerolineae bacterium]